MCRRISTRAAQRAVLAQIDQPPARERRGNQTRLRSPISRKATMRSACCSVYHDNLARRSTPASSSSASSAAIVRLSRKVHLAQLPSDWTKKEYRLVAAEDTLVHLALPHNLKCSQIWKPLINLTATGRPAGPTLSDLLDNPWLGVLAAVFWAPVSAAKCKTRQLPVDSK